MRGPLRVLRPRAVRRGRAARERGARERVEQHDDGHRIADDVMQIQQDHVIVVAQFEYRQPARFALFEREALAARLGEALGDARGLMLRQQRRQIVPANRGRAVRRDFRARFAAAHDEAGAQHVVRIDERLIRGFERVRVPFAAHAQRAGQVERRVRRVQPVEEEELLLVR